MGARHDSLRRTGLQLCRAALLVGAAALSTGCYGLSAESRYPDLDMDEEQEKLLLTPENEDDPSISLNEFTFSDQLCADVDVHTETRPVAQDEFTRFLDRIKKPPTQVKARGNLYWYEFPGEDPNDGDVVRLRLAVLDSAEEAADELHQSLLQHGPGWWGLRRGNLSILAPKTGLSTAVAFAVQYKLPCWGAMMVAGLDDVYVVPGPYTEM